MQIDYKTSDGDMLDEVAFRFYGKVNSQILDQVIAANPGIAETGAVLQAGKNIVFPEIVDTQKGTQAVRLWE